MEAPGSIDWGASPRTRVQVGTIFPIGRYLAINVLHGVATTATPRRLTTWRRGDYDAYSRDTYMAS